MIRIYCLRKESISNQRENTYEESNDRGVPSTDGYIYNTVSKHYTQGTLQMKDWKGFKRLRTRMFAGRYG